MRRRLLIGIVIVSAGLVAFVLAFPDMASVSLGLIRHEAFFAGKPTNYWVRALKHEKFLGQAQPAGDIGKTLREGGSPAVSVLCEIAEDGDEDARGEALRGLALMGTEARAAMPVLAATIKKERNSGRFLVASETLAKLDSAAAAEALSSVLSDKQDPGRRAWALTELSKLAPNGREALPVLNGLLHDPDEDARLRVQTIRVLWRLNEPTEPLVSSLCDFLNADASPVGVQALEVLGEMGPAARLALPTLLKLLEKPTLGPISPKVLITATLGASASRRRYQNFGRDWPRSPGSRARAYRHSQQGQLFPPQRGRRGAGLYGPVGEGNTGSAGCRLVDEYYPPRSLPPGQHRVVPPDPAHEKNLDTVGSADS